ncbi:MAG: pitrilysin family protein [Sulfurospirillaceae bacterium]|nr:pitrilysin family protein [Sulfurospirillaceae bacterium]MDD2826036.1 pitrilysin family protein [Sulfurospirillaceae bacterium]
MRALIFLMIFLQGVLVSQEISKVTINGIDVPIVFEKEANLPIASLQIVVKNSGSMEDGETEGIAKFLSSMLGEGTKELGATGFAEELEFRAISLSVHAGTETLVFEVSSLKEQFPYALEMVKKLLKSPNFTKESFDKVKLMTLGMLSSKESDFDYLANLNLQKILFEGTPFAHAYNGDVKSIKALKLKEVENFFKEHMILENIIVVAGGDIELETLKKELQPILVEFKKGATKKLPYFEASKKSKEVMVEKKSEQAYIYFGSPFYMKSGDENAYKAKVASFILGESGFGSRLMEEIRVKRGLAYSAYSRTSVGKSHSSFTGHLQTKVENLDQAKQLVKDEVKRFCDEGVSAEELAQAKRFLLGSEPLRNETLSQRLSRAFFEYYGGFELGHSKKQLDKIEKLTLEELNEFIRSHDEINHLSFSIVTAKRAKK